MGGPFVTEIWQRFTIPIPPAARTAITQFRFWQGWLPGETPGEMDWSRAAARSQRRTDGRRAARCCFAHGPLHAPGVAGRSGQRLARNASHASEH